MNVSRQIRIRRTFWGANSEGEGIEFISHPPGRGAVRTSHRLRALAVIAFVIAQVMILSPLANAAPGDLDLSFGTDGKVITGFVGGSAGASSVALQPDGKVVVAGLTGLTSFAARDFALARYNPDGSVDASFGTEGTLTTDFAGGSDVAVGVALQPDGKIVAAGFTGPPDGDFRQFALARYNADGAPDSSFGTDGQVITDFPSVDEAASAVALQPDGKIVTAGIAFTSSGFGDFIVARYNPDGTLDLSFGTGGEATTNFGDHDGAFAVALQPDGKVVAAGFSFGTPTLEEEFALARYSSDGALDPTFGTGGEVTTDFNSFDDGASAVAVQPDGKIVAAGGSFPSPTTTDFALARYEPNGALDLAFGTGGMVTTDFAGAYDLAEDVALQPDGKIVAAGLTGVLAGDEFDFALARYDSDGSLDAFFGTGGRVTTDFAGGTDEAGGVALQPDGKIVAAGVATVGSSQDVALARYEGGAVITVHVDIKPGSRTNPIKLSSAGTIPVAILSTSSFDATTVDPTSVCFGDAEAPAQRDCTMTYQSLQDVDGDVRLDLLLHFDTKQTGIDLGDTQACLTGRTSTGLTVEGCDSIKTI
jgi:uncharacterized delta-60 repeat protein